MQTPKRLPRKRYAMHSVLALAIIAASVAATPRSAAAETTAAAEAQETAVLALTVRNVRLGAGPVMIAVFDSEEGWKGTRRAVRGERIEATARDITVTLAGLKPGVYGVKLFQDINGDGRMDANPFGIPTEPFAFSNDAPVRFGPPKWQAAQFTVASGAAAHAITLPE